MKKSNSTKITKAKPLSKNKCGLKVIQENIANSTIKSLNEHVYNQTFMG